MNWNSTIRIKHLLSNDNSDAAVDRAAVALAKVLSESSHDFYGVVGKLKNLPETNDFFTKCEAFNKVMDLIYDYCDSFGIWVE